MLRLLERCVALRSSLGQRPYGDQGLLIHRDLESQVEGYRPLPLMEDLDLVMRITATSSVRRIGCAIFTSARRWQRRSVLNQAWRNAQLRRAWRRGARSASTASAPRTLPRCCLATCTES